MAVSLHCTSSWTQEGISFLFNLNSDMDWDVRPNLKRGGVRWVWSYKLGVVLLTCNDQGICRVDLRTGSESNTE